MQRSEVYEIGAGGRVLLRNVSFEAGEQADVLRVIVLPTRDERKSFARLANRLHPQLRIGFVGTIITLHGCKDLTSGASPCGGGAGGKTKKEAQAMSKKPTAKKSAKVTPKAAEKKSATVKKPQQGAKGGKKATPAKKSRKG